MMVSSAQITGSLIFSRKTTAAMVASCPIAATHRNFINHDAFTINLLDGLGIGNLAGQNSANVMDVVTTVIKAFTAIHYTVDNYRCQR